MGVQTNQFPRAMDIAEPLRAAGIAVCIGGFHVSGCIAMLPDMPPELQEAMDLGVTLFAGEAEGRLDDLLRAAYRDELQPLYNFMKDLPGLAGAAVPYLPRDVVRRTSGTRTSFDAGRGCPFLCSFCTIINVQGRKSRSRSADDVEQLVRANLAQGVHNFFITDDNLARNQNWEAIFDRLIKMREEEGLRIHVVAQVDTHVAQDPRVHRERQAAPGVNRVFIGLESINPDALKEARKGQNQITEYRAMLQAWHRVGTLTYAGYILGFPGDTPASIERDIRIIQRELPIDLLEFFILTPLPGSADHKKLHLAGVEMARDMNNYDLVHVTTRHPSCRTTNCVAVYRKAWDIYYSPEHVERVDSKVESLGLRSAEHDDQASDVPRRPAHRETCIRWRAGYSGTNIAATPAGDAARKSIRVLSSVRLEIVSKHVRFARMYWQHWRILRRVERDSNPYIDVAMTPVQDTEFGEMQMYTATPAAKFAVEKLRRRKSAHAVGPRELAPIGHHRAHEAERVQYDSRSALCTSACDASRRRDL